MVKKNKETLNKQEKTDVFLLVVDATDEFSIAVDYAARYAAKYGAKLALLNVIQPEAFDHWLNVEKKIKKELRAEAENLIWETSRRVMNLSGKIPMVCIEEGERSDVIVDILNKNKNITKLILGGESHSSNPGPLVSYFSGKGLSRLRVPLLVVPGHLGTEDLENLFGLTYGEVPEK